MSILEVGQRVYCALGWAGMGTIVRIHGEQSPETVGMAGGVMSYGGSAYFDVVFDGGASTNHTPESIIRGIQWKIYPEVVSAAEVAAAVKSAEAYKAEQAAKAARERAAKAAAVDFYVPILRGTYPKAVTSEKLVRGRPISSYARAAANLRAELKATFPGVKFSVKSKGYSMGNSVDVSWELGPSTSEVEKIAYKYKYGRFDGMQDLSYSDNSAFGDAVEMVLGRAKHVMVSRQFPAGLADEVGRLICEAQGVEYCGPSTRNVFGGGDYDTVSDYAYRVLSATSFPVGAEIAGIEDNPDDCRVPYWLVLSVPGKPECEPTESGDCCGASVEQHYHDKRGFYFWLVVPAERMERSEFVAKRSACKAVGGWYSRKWGRTPGGFAFESEADAQQFAAAHFAGVLESV